MKVGGKIGRLKQSGNLVSDSRNKILNLEKRKERKDLSVHLIVLPFLARGVGGILKGGITPPVPPSFYAIWREKIHSFLPHRTSHCRNR